MRILVTGFDAFGKEKINPSIEAVKRLPDIIEGADIIKKEIPTVLYESLQVIEKILLEEDPDVIISVGQAGGRNSISIERIGINIDDFRIPDNAGNQPIDIPIAGAGPAAYFVNVPIKAMAAHIQSKGIPASISNSAGTFVCNHVTYGVRHLIETKYKGKRSGFIHIPFLPEQTQGKENMPSMELDMMVAGLTAAMEAIVLNDQDILAAGGSLD